MIPLTVVSPFDPPPQDWLPGHRGVDLAAARGIPVRAVGEGVVSFAGPVAGRGVVVVDHGSLRTTYEPVAAEVRPGQRVTPGTILGHIREGAGHCGSGDCLHLGLRRGREYFDPLLLLRGARVVLVPW